MRHCTCVRVVPMALVGARKCGTNCTHWKNTHSNRIISVTSQLNHFFVPFKKSNRKHSGLRYHTSTLHCWTWPPRLLGGGSVIFQIQPARWYSADTQLAASSSWRRRVKVSKDKLTPPPTSTPPPTTGISYVRRSGILKPRGQNCCLISRSKRETWQLIGTVVAAADSVLSLWVWQKTTLSLCGSAGVSELGQFTLLQRPEKESAAAPMEGIT